MKPCRVVLTLLLASIAGGQATPQPVGQPASQPARELKFREAGVEAMNWKGEYSPPEIIRPTWAAVVTLVGWYDTEAVASWIKQTGGQLPGLSADQRAFLQQNVYVAAGTRDTVPVRVAGRMESGTVTLYTLFAVSEQDARRMGILLINYFDGQAQKRLDGDRRTLAEAVETLRQAPERIQEYQARLKQLDDQVKSLGLGRDDSDAWSRMIEEAKPTLKALEIERAGQTARLRKIQEYMAQQTQPAKPAQAGRSPASQPDAAVLTALETMLVQLNVEMAGTQAKQEAIEKEIAPYRQAVELVRKRSEAWRMKEEWQTNLDRAKSTVEYLPKRLAEPSADLQPVQVKNDTIELVRVQATASQPAEN